ncbi:hypothetical protein DIPPA_13279 [Diplonema papillatum]|nr:hypothetical protein DIPPA_13279 [Diplonema papillatum]KAJ9464084.1 hypothetical protein DIPPA_13279 [Diplonema papillatum]
MIRRLIISSLALCIVQLHLASAQCAAELSGAVFRVDNPTRESSQAATAALAGGRVVVWLDAASNSVWGTLYDDSWTVAKKAELATPTAGTAAAEVHIAPLRGDAFIVTWREVADDGTSAIVGQLFDWDRVDSAAFEIVSRRNVTDYSVANTTGGYAVAWNNAHPRYTLGVSFDAAGNTISSSSVTDQALYGPLALLGTDDGGIVIAHSEDEGSKYIAMYNAHGGWARSIPFAFTSTNPLVAAARLGGGYSAIAWADRERVHTAVFNLSWYLSDVEVVDAGASSREEDTRPAVVGLSDGRFVVAWHRRTPPSIAARAYRFEGGVLQAAGGVFEVSGDAPSEEAPALGAAPAGGFYAVWAQTDGNVYARRFAFPGGEAPSTAGPGGSSPPTAAPATGAPSTTAPITAPATNAPSTTAPITAAPATDAPSTTAPSTAAPATNAPPTTAPTSAAPPTNAPSTTAPTTAPATNAPSTTAPITAAPATNAPSTTAPSTATNAPSTTAPITAAPATNAPPTTAPTTAPATTAPATAAPSTTAPTTAAPATVSPATPWPGTSAPVGLSEGAAALLARIDALRASWAARHAAAAQRLASCRSCSGAGGETPAPPADGDGAAAVAELRRRVANLTAVVALGGAPGRDGLCPQGGPKTASVYVPVIRYPHKGFGDNGNDCVFGGANLSLAGTVDMNCRWGPYMTSQTIYAYVGDTLVFWRDRQDWWNVVQLESEAAYRACDVSRAKLVAGLVDMSTVEAVGRNFTITLDRPGRLYYTSVWRNAISQEDRREHCSLWGTKIAVTVLEPGEEVRAECPVYEPAEYGINGPEDAADSAAVEKLKGAVAAMGRQMVSIEQRTAERLREEGQSGVTVVRTYNGGTDAFYSASYSETGAANMHNHADTHHTVGLGEFGAVLNGVQFTTRHNDYSLLEPDDALTVDEFKSTWPPRAKEIEQPPVPPSVLDAGSVAAQMAEMREYFRAFHTQNVTHRDYRPYFPAVVCYLEGTWTEAADDIAEPFASERHRIDAATWTELTQKNNFLFNNGQKDSSENLPFLPTSFRGMKEDAGDTFEPIIAQWFYRISCKKLDEDLPTSTMRVRNDANIQLAESPPATRERLSTSPRALFDLHPDPAQGEWPKGKTSWEFLDDVMYNISGFDGPNADLVDNSFGETCGTYSGGGVLNSARYTRYFALLSRDAMGRSTKKRSFNDMLFAAQTTHPRVSPQAVCEGEVAAMPTSDARDTERIGFCEGLGEDACRGQAPWPASDVTAGASGAKCHWAAGRCEYRKCWEQRWSYAIPLEIVYLTPLSEWNPYGIPYVSDSNSPDYAAVTADGRDGTAGRPYRFSRQNVFFRTPAELFGDLADVDEADTSGGATYVLDSSETARRVRASGHWMIFPEMDGMHVRQRYPIFPVHEQGATIWKEAKAVEELIVGGAHNEHVAAIIAEQRGQNYGLTLELTGTGHVHEVFVTPAELRSLKSGSMTSLVKITSLANGHQHSVQIDYDADAPAGGEWSIDWCGSPDQNTCVRDPAGCVSEDACCFGACPDRHSGVRIV